MPRIRTIKPSFFTSLTIADLTVEQRLTFIGLWTHVDDDGRCVYDSRLIKAAVWPLDDRTADDVADDVQALTEASLITHYKVRERSYLAVNGWEEHQRVNRRTPSTLPAPGDGTEAPISAGQSALTEDSVRPHGAITEDSRQERKGREGNKDSDYVGDAVASSDEPTAQTLVAEWIDHCQQRPPGRVIGQLSKEIKSLLNEGTPYDETRQAVAAWHERGLHPATLPSIVHELRTPQRRRGTQTTDDRVRAGLELAERLADADTDTLPLRQIGS